ncbi:MAG: hypothetical protein OXP66_11740 [Candidatus Tectomicrobia bacterium]|nr:hypothetical protein [Candidatus Tectomicrobia bacterium]
MREIIFEVTEDEVNGGYSASALGYGIHAQGESDDDICRNVKEAVDCYFDETMVRPRLIRLYFVRDDVRGTGLQAPPPRPEYEAAVGSQHGSYMHGQRERS